MIPEAVKNIKPAKTFVNERRGQIQPAYTSHQLFRQGSL